MADTIMEDARAEAPSFANPQGNDDFVLDENLAYIYNHWRAGKQIVLLVGAGLSVQSGYPAINALGEHLLLLHAIKNRRLQYVFSGILPEVPAYSLERDGWVSLSRLPSFCSQYEQSKMGKARAIGQRKLLEDVIIDRLTKPDFFPSADESKYISESINRLVKGAVDTTLIGYAADHLGLGWLELLESIADNRPQLVDSMFVDLGTPATPGPAHNLLSHCISQFNIRLVLTTNFDNLIERSLIAEGHNPVVFDIHMTAPLPPAELVKRHLSIVKLHGSSYGLRADRSINVPLDNGDLQTFLDYFEKGALLICLDYGGGDARVMGLIERLLVRDKDEPEDKQSRVIRVDGMVPGPGNRFVNNPAPGRVSNLFYPPAGLFLLQLYQFASGRLPRSRGVYPAVIQSPAPHREQMTLGFEAGTKKDLENRPNKRERIHAKLALSLFNRLEGISDTRIGGHPATDRHHAVLVVGDAGCGTSQVLAQVCERLYKGYQMFWCDLDQAVSVGTVLSRLHDFVSVRQADLPRTPLPIDMPSFCPPVSRDIGTGDLNANLTSLRDRLAGDLVHLRRVTRSVWGRLAQGRYVVVFDSLSYALSEMAKQKDNRMDYEACRLLLIVSLLFQQAARNDPAQKCLFLLGTHQLDSSSGDAKRLMDVCLSAIELAGRAGLSTSDLKEIAESVVLCDREALREKWRSSFDHVIKSDKTSGSQGNAIMGCYGWDDSPANFVFASVDRGDYTYSLTIDDQKYTYENLEEEVGSKGLLGAAGGDTSCNRSYIRFLYECAWCNRPRSWCQILSLPEVRTLSQDQDALDKLKDKFAGLVFPRGGAFNHWDNRSQAAYLLVKRAARGRFLYLQPGGFYFMDGRLRDWLRKLSGNDQKYSQRKEPHKDSPSPLESAHHRQMRYYDRAYNQSGDISALNYFCWHGSSLLELSKRQQGINREEIIKEMARCLLENTQAARGHLNAYDHCFLLLRLYDQGASEFHDPSLGLKAIGDQILKAVGDLYEDNEDASGGAKVMLALYGGKDCPFGSEDELTEFENTLGTNSSFLAEFYHDLQKVRSRKRDLKGALIAGFRALDALENRETEQVELSERILRLAMANSKRTQLQFELKDPRLFHGVILRLIRVLLRVLRFASDDFLGPDNWRPIVNESIRCLLSIGKTHLARLDEDSDSEHVKLLWARYHVLRGLHGVYQLSADSPGGVNSIPYVGDKTVKVLYYFDLASCYASKVGGSLGKTYGAVANLLEAEVLLWEARFIMRLARDKVDLTWTWGEALARQKAGIRNLELVQRALPQGHAALVWWCELAILHTAATADILKLTICKGAETFAIELTATEASFHPERFENLDQEQYWSLAEAYERASRYAERGTRDLRLLVPVTGNDPWRRARLVIQMLRLSWYLSGMVSIAVNCLEADLPDAKRADVDSARQRLIPCVNRLLRALRGLELAALDEENLLWSRIPLLPLVPNDRSNLPADESTIKELARDFQDRFTKCLTNLDSVLLNELRTRIDACRHADPSKDGLIKSIDSLNDSWTRMETILLHGSPGLQTLKERWDEFKGLPNRAHNSKTWCELSLQCPGEYQYGDI